MGSQPSQPDSPDSPEAWILTGGAGFIGSNLVRLLRRERPEVALVVVDKLTYAGSLENLVGLDGGLSTQPGEPGATRLAQIDIADAEAIGALFDEVQPTHVLNLAAESHVDRSIDDPGEFIRTNIQGTYVLLEAFRRLHVGQSPAPRRSGRFLQVSTDEVYGSLGETGYFTEETPVAPNSPYSASKASADMLVRAYHHTYGLQTITTNCSNNYGPNQLPEKLIPLMALNALEGRALPIYGDGRNVRDWIFVEDHCAGILAALERGRAGETYAFGASTERSNREIVDAICRLCEKIRPAAQNEKLRAGGHARYEDLIQFVEDRPGHDRRYAIDAARARDELGWSPAHTFDDALERTVGWYAERLGKGALPGASQSDVRARRGLSTGSTETPTAR